jgi:Uma2 family endonuclease
MEERSDMPVTVTRRRFNVDEYYRMADAGIFHPEERAELIDGEVLAVAQVSPRRASIMCRLGHLFSRFDERFIVSIRHPLRLDEWNEPEPDFILLQLVDDFYAAGHPGPDDVFLAVEVSDSTLGFDREIKGPLYARTGVAEFWLVDLSGEAIEVHREPGSEGYAESKRLGRGESLAPLAFPDLDLAVDEILG